MPRAASRDASLSRNPSTTREARPASRAPSRSPRRSPPHEFIPLRNSTLILPATGERVKRTITLSNPVTANIEESRSIASTRNPAYRFDAQEMGPESPLLATHRKPPQSRTKQRRILPSGLLGKRLAVKYETSVLLRRIWAFCISRTGQGILKCSIAYLFGSMGTFVPFLSNYLGDQDGKHIMATCTVYFHPARSQGSMFEAGFMAILAFLYAAFIAFTSMGVEVLFDKKLELIVVGHAIVLGVFCGGGLGLVGWIKHKRGNPLVNVACSLTSLAIITVLTKEESIREAEFSTDKIVQVMKMVLMGIVATTVVNFTILPVSARKDFSKNLVEMTDSLGDMLAMITRGFLTGSEEELEQRGFQDVSARYKGQYAALSKNLSEAKWEHYVFGTEGQYVVETKLLNCMRRLSRNIGGLRSAATTQFGLLSQSTGNAVTPVASVYTPTTAGLSNKLSRINSWMSFQENFETLEGTGGDLDRALEAGTQISGEDDLGGLLTARTPADIFERFIMHLGPSMKSLAFTLKTILDELPYGDDQKSGIVINPNFRSSLVSAIDLYSNARSEALKILYKGQALSMSRPADLEADFEEVAASCGYFSTSLQDFAEEMKGYLDILDELKEELEKPASKRLTWNWLKVWQPKSDRSSRKTAKEDDHEHDALMPSNEEEGLNTEQPSPAYVQNDVTFGRFPKRYDNATWGQRFRRATRAFRRDETKFAVKVGAGAALFALPSFIEDTQPFYEHWRGEWGLLSYMLVCSMTIGASNTTGFARAWGTVLGAVCAVVAWLLSQGNVFLMAFFGWIMAVGGFYIIVGQGKGPLGRFILLSYNLTALYAYSLSVKDDEWWDEDEEGKGHDPLIGDIALHRVVAVLVGCLWGLMITRLVWPISARKKFRNGLSLLLLRMGLIWKRDPLSTLLSGKSDAYINQKEELELQRYLSRLEGLKESASHEFELKGPFETAEYAAVLKSVGKMLDAFHAMNVVVSKDSKVTPVELDLLGYTASERSQLCSRISHLFQGTFCSEWTVI